MYNVYLYFHAHIHIQCTCTCTYVHPYFVCVVHLDMHVYAQMESLLHTIYYNYDCTSLDLMVVLVS